MAKIKAWSYSRLINFEQCTLKAKLQYIDKIPEPERPLPPDKTEHANDRGSRVHDAAERFIQGGVELIPELKNFEDEFLRLRDLYTEGKVALEGEWGYDQDWSPVAWMSSDVWARVKLDALVHLSPTHAVVIDYKTGRKYGNEIKHAEQGQLYQLAAFMRFPELEKIDVEFWYLDKDEITYTKYRRSQGMKFFKNFNDRGKKITECEDFKPNANQFSCRWCPYGPKGTGHCEVGVQ